MRKSGLLSALAYLSTARAATPEEWRARSIYQIITDRFARPGGDISSPCNTKDQVYCGGTYQGIIDRLDYIQGMGIDSIWISPITAQIAENTPSGSSYHGYWQSNLYELNSLFGSAEELNALAAELHARNMYLMVDVVVNHNGWAGEASSVDYSQFVPFNSKDQYNEPCDIDYDDQSSIEDCWLVTTGTSLPDLKTSDPGVAEVFNSWITGLVSNYSVDGLRIDTVKHVEKEFFPAFVEAAGVYSIGEILDGDPAYTCPYQDYMPGVLNYPVYYPLLETFQATTGSMGRLIEGMNGVSQACADPSLLGTFSENHDTPRFASYTDDIALAQNVLAFNVLADGIPIIYAGQEQHYSGGNDPDNREAVWLSGFPTDAPLYQLIASANKLRTFAAANEPEYITTLTSVLSNDEHTVAMKKGNVVTVLTNVGANGGDASITVEGTGYTGEVMDVISCEPQAVEGGNLAVTLSGGAPKVFYPVEALAGSGLCETT
ncbi:hypothetical protein AJ79_01183 [Helicocarpus griseus UAMH5409]|uniref:alpha-amylase n=1 Tax=Helicocarpus griseus UAMH5409 TaxID=1447875 RepID=A0A2B7Y873_9EURO|nr:hypothetical protein AJ79_01183 [Helicocarpus griseus UAMH5409]